MELTHKAVDHFFHRQVFRSIEVSRRLNAKGRMTALRLLDRFVAAGVIKELTDSPLRRVFPGRGRLFIFNRLLELL